jgi:hypothetical protein
MGTRIPVVPSHARQRHGTARQQQQQQQQQQQRSMAALYSWGWSVLRKFREWPGIFGLRAHFLRQEPHVIRLFHSGTLRSHAFTNTFRQTPIAADIHCMHASIAVPRAYLKDASTYA